MIRRFWIDVVERTAATYVVALLGLLTADGFDLTNLGALRAALVASLPAALTVVKSVAASLVGDPTTAALLPRSRQ